MRKGSVPECSPEARVPLSVSLVVGLHVQHTGALCGRKSNNDAEVVVKNWQKAPKKRVEPEKINMLVWGEYEGCFTQKGIKKDD